MYIKASRPSSGWRAVKTPRFNEQAKMLAPCLRQQRENRIELRAALASSMNGIALETQLVKSRISALASPIDNSGVGDVCDQDFAVSLLTEGADALFKIDETLALIEEGIYNAWPNVGPPDVVRASVGDPLRSPYERRA